MAVVWSHRSGGQRYEIRTAGRSIRLYTNGVLHSQYNPEHLFGGGVWDLLGLPALWRGERHIPAILLLGLGGGAVVRQLHELVRWDRLVAVERNPVHLDVSRRFFGLAWVPAELVETDAGRWIAGYTGDGFDLVIDDLFGDDVDEAKRSQDFSGDWYGGLRALLSDRGTLVVNFADGRDLKRRLRRIPGLKQDFERIYRLTMPAYGNAIAVLQREAREPAQLVDALHTAVPPKKRTRLRYHLEPVRL